MADSTAIPRDLLSVGAAAQMLSVSVQTIRNYCEVGELQNYRVGKGAHRRISRSSIMNYLHGGCLDSPTGKVLAYARTSSPSQKLDLNRQVERLTAYAKEKYADKELMLFKDNASSMNWNRVGLNKLLKEIMSGMHRGSTLLLSHFDRLGRHCKPILLLLCEHFEVNVLCIEQDDEASLETMMTEELLQIVHLYSIRMYGQRSAVKKRVRPSEDALKRGAELREQGQTATTILTILKAEGFKCDNGKEITLPAVKTYIIAPAKKVAQTSIKQGKNSIDEFKEQMIRRSAPNARLGVLDSYDFYIMWCRENSKLAVHRQQFSACLKEFGIGYHDKKRCWMGMEIIGARLHVFIKEHRTKHQPETPQLRFDRFLERITPFYGSIDEIRGLYHKFCKDESAPMLSNNDIFEFLKNKNVKRMRVQNAYKYKIGG